jgi:hypothetical protein
MTEDPRESEMKATLVHTKDSLDWAEGKIESETLAPFRDPVKGAGQTRIATLKYPWKYVIEAYEARFPTNPLFPYIEKTEVLLLEKTKHTKKEVRKVSIDPGMPGWLKSLTRLHSFVFIEESFIDYQNKYMKLFTRNDSLSRYVSVSEDCVYKQHLENVDWTLKEQTASYKLHTYLFGLESKIEDYGSWIFIERAKDALKQEKILIEKIMAKYNK